MLLETKLEQWLKAGFALYKQHPILSTSVFYDASHTGFPTGVTTSAIQDATKLWIPDEYVGGVVRYGSLTLPIVGNSAVELVVDGDPSLEDDPDGLGYTIVPPAAGRLQELLEKQTMTVTTAFPQVPIQSPIFSIRLERDTQGPTYVGESVERWAIQGVEFDANRMTIVGAYLISIWADNRLATLWLYSWLLHYALLSQQQFSTWGLSDVSLGGSDLDPATPLLPEHVYVRHLLLTATRDERAVSARDVEYITGLCLNLEVDYARLEAELPQPLP